MKKSIIISAVSLLLFVISLGVTVQQVRGQVKDYAVATTQNFNERASESLDAILVGGKRIAYGFLAGYFYPMTDGMNEGGTSLDLLRHSRFRVSEVDRKNLTLEDLYLSLEGLLKINSSCFVATFLMEADAFPNMPKKYRAPMVYRDFSEGEVMRISEYERKGLKRADLHDIVDYENRRHYRDALAPGYETVWHKTSWSSDTNGIQISYYVPIFRDDGKALGVFCMSFPLLDYANYTIQKGLPFKGGIMQIYSQDGAQILSTASVEIDTTKYLRFETDVQSNNWKIVTYIPEDQIFTAATYIQHILWFTSLLSIVLVSIAATSISRSLRKSVKQKAALTNELQLAHKTQMEILSPTQFVTDKFKLNAFLLPAKDVGGDLYDYYLHKATDGSDRDILYFIVGDVSGKGMPAALMMTQVCSLFRDIVRSERAPEKILARINEVLAERNDSMMFCTAFLGAIDLETFEMTYANAGHHRPVIIPAINGEPDTQSAYYLDMKANRPLAIMENSTFRGGSVQLQKGSQVLLFTDGVTESMSRDGKLFGDDNLLRTLQRGESPVDAVKKHSEGAAQSDDITLLKISLA